MLMWSVYSPKKTLTGAVKGIAVEQVKELKAMAIQGVAAKHEVNRLKEENKKLNSCIPSGMNKCEENRKSVR